MCGRYAVFDDGDIPELIAVLNAANALGVPFSTGEIFPTFNTPIIKRTGQNSISVDIMRWGYDRVIPGGKTLINARGETVTDKPTFRDDFSARRCVIPSTGFYEWNHSGANEKYLFNLENSKLLCMAGFFRPDKGFVIITLPANHSMSPYHSRMPLVLDKNEVRRYICDFDFAFSKLRSPNPDLIATRSFA